MNAPSPFGLLLVSQGALADELINTASGVLGARPADVLVACARNGDKRADIESRVRKAVDQLVAKNAGGFSSSATSSAPPPPMSPASSPKNPPRSPAAAGSTWRCCWKP